jgi:exodeoxyribonuclease VII small subunit
VTDETAPTIDFEAALKELEALVQRMETGSLTLEESLAAFERGVHLTRECQRALAAAELRVKALTETDAGPALADFDRDALDET